MNINVALELDNFPIKNVSAVYFHIVCTQDNKSHTLEKFTGFYVQHEKKKHISGNLNYTVLQLFLHKKYRHLADFTKLMFLTPRFFYNNFGPIFGPNFKKKNKSEKIKTIMCKHTYTFV